MFLSSRVAWATNVSNPMEVSLSSWPRPSPSSVAAAVVGSVIGVKVEYPRWAALLAARVVARGSVVEQGTVTWSDTTLRHGDRLSPRSS